MPKLAKFTAILILTLSSSGAMADEQDWWAASSEQVKNARCQFEQDSSAQARKAFLDSFENKSAQSYLDAEVFGVHFNQEAPEFIYKFMLLSRRVQEDGEPDSEHQVDLLKKYPRLSSCSKVRCALKVMFGPEIGERMLYLIVKYDFNTSPLAFANASLLRVKELDSILFTLERVPPFLTKLGLNQKLVRYLLGKGRPGMAPQTIANAEIEFFDPFTTLSPPEQSRTVYHEIAHNWSDSLNDLDLDNSREWLELSGWTQDSSGAWSSADDASFVSQYAGTSPAEDFAETAVAYRFNPQHLKNNSPEKYQYMKMMVYGGNEYGPGSHCERESLLAGRIRKELKADLQADKLKAISARLLILCRDSYAAATLHPDKTHEFYDCIQSTAAQEMPLKKMAIPSEVTPRYLVDPYFNRMDLGDYTPSPQVLELFRRDLQAHPAK